MVNFFRLKPLSGVFAVDEIERKLMALPFAVKDPLNEGTYFLHYSAEKARELAQQRKKNPGSPLPHVAIIRVWRDEIDIVQETLPEIIDRIAGFVLWTIQRAPCQAEDEEGAPIEAPTAEDLVEILCG